jgi:hypothetical protein
MTDCDLAELRGKMFAFKTILSCCLGFAATHFENPAAYLVELEKSIAEGVTQATPNFVPPKYRDTFVRFATGWGGDSNRGCTGRPKRANASASVSPSIFQKASAMRGTPAGDYRKPKPRRRLPSAFAKEIRAYAARTGLAAWAWNALHANLFTMFWFLISQGNASYHATAHRIWHTIQNDSTQREMLLNRLLKKSLPILPEVIPWCRARG